MIFYNPDDFINHTFDTHFDIVKTKKGSFYNVACAFDIETSSFYVSDNKQYTNDNHPANAIKQACLYVWQFAINDDVLIMRTYTDFVNFLKKLSIAYGLSNKLKIVVYVHNLSYEFQFIRKWLPIQNVFADSERSILYFDTDLGFEFRCSYRLSGYSLATVAKNLHDKKYSKMVGDLDYTLTRNVKTPLTEKEIGYCANDVLVVTQFIHENITEYGDITKIPLTQTGKVRRVCRNKCFENPNYKNLMRGLTLDANEYKMLKMAFQGGFTHAGILHVNDKLENVTSYDFTSSYPTVMIAEKYPMGKGYQIKIDNIDTLKKLTKKFCLLVCVKIDKLTPKFIYENIISYSRCFNVKNPTINNGRIMTADSLETICTEIDIINYERFYKWDKISFGVCYAYKKDYLPKEIVSTVLDFYEAKTTLKGVAGKETEYLHGKELLNSLYGMSVTDIVHDNIQYDNIKNEWFTGNVDVEKAINEYNTSKNRFLFYAWGVWVTAYARNNLYTGILSIGKDYVYSDTDSVKILNAEKYKNYFDKYNVYITQKITKALQYHKIDESRAKPKTVKGVEKPLGIWDFDGFYTQFKTLGAKRYIYTENNELHITVAGLTKSLGRDYIQKQQNPYDFFSDNMIIPANCTGKLTHTYIDKECMGIVRDYLNNFAEYHEKSIVHLENTSFTLSMLTDYISLILGYKKLSKLSTLQ